LAPNARGPSVADHEYAALDLLTGRCRHRLASKPSPGDLVAHAPTPAPRGGGSIADGLPASAASGTPSAHAIGGRRPPRELTIRASLRGDLQGRFRAVDSPEIDLAGRRSRHRWPPRDLRGRFSRTGEPIGDLRGRFAVVASPKNDPGGRSRSVWSAEIDPRGRSATVR
jgi:hypothetical protein